MPRANDFSTTVGERFDSESLCRHRSADLSRNQVHGAGLEYRGVDAETVTKRVNAVMGLPAILAVTAGAETTLFI